MPLPTVLCVSMNACCCVVVSLLKFVSACLCRLTAVGCAAWAMPIHALTCYDNQPSIVVVTWF
jgi:hypothetical protein